ncbi:MAG: cation transporter [Bacteroidetes bacterium]|nr:cation transporter [Bacteroidota bacterium]
MSHSHDHNHSHHHPGHGQSHLFVLGILLNTVFVAVEFFFGVYSGSVSLIADAWHNLGDVAGMAVSLLAFRMASRKPTAKFTYGFSKGTILASLANCVLLFIAVGSIGYEAFDRFFHPVHAEPWTMGWVATLGIVINAATAMLFFRQKELNSRAAYLHMLADALVSAGVVLAGVLIFLTGWQWVDSLAGLLICVVILRGTWQLLKQSLTLSMDGVPDSINMEAVKNTVNSYPQIKDIHHVHIWAMSTTRNALTAHLTVIPMTDQETGELKRKLKHDFRHLNIHHTTLELENSHAQDCDTC